VLLGRLGDLEWGRSAVELVVRWRITDKREPVSDRPIDLGVPELVPALGRRPAEELADSFPGQARLRKGGSGHRPRRSARPRPRRRRYAAARIRTPRSPTSSHAAASISSSTRRPRTSMRRQPGDLAVTVRTRARSPRLAAAQAPAARSGSSWLLPGLRRRAGASQRGSRTGTRRCWRRPKRSAVEGSTRRNTELGKSDP